MSYNGILPIYKPRGISSKDVSRALTKTLGKVKMGHVGTLDPEAEGVLPILLGSATRIQDLLLEHPKTYLCTVLLGETTDSLDRDGTRIAEAPWEHVTLAQCEATARQFLGKIAQTPPAFSAIKHQGKPLYAYARNQLLAPEFLANFTRTIEIHQLSIEKLEGRFLTFRATCSKGTYIRSLARDLCEALATCGMVERLVRECSSGIPLEQTIQLNEITSSSLIKQIIPLTSLSTVNKILLNSKQDCADLLQGKYLELERFAGIQTELPPQFLIVSPQAALGLGIVVPIRGRSMIRLQRSLL